jgi:hypothetical protein
LLNHSCQPNSFITIKNKTAHIWATETLKPGDEVFISYVSGLQNFNARQSDLLKRFFFICDCGLCVREIQERLNPHNEDNRMLKRGVLSDYRSRESSLNLMNTLIESFMEMQNFSGVFAVCCILNWRLAPYYIDYNIENPIICMMYQDTAITGVQAVLEVIEGLANGDEYDPLLLPCIWRITKTCLLNISRSKTGSNSPDCFQNAFPLYTLMDNFGYCYPEIFLPDNNIDAEVVSSYISQWFHGYLDYSPQEALLG